MDAHEAYSRTLEVENNTKEDLLMKIDKAIENAVNSGSYETVVDISAYRSNVINDVISNLRSRKYRIYYDDWSYNGAANERLLMIDWSPSWHTKFQEWLDRMNLKVGAILNPNG